MPITPLHLLAGVGVKAAQPKLDFTTFILVNVAIDIESAIGLLTHTGYEDAPIHGVCHSLWGATIVALVLVHLTIKRPYATRSALFAAWSHVILDAFYHPDVYLLLPGDGLRLYGLIPPLWIDWFCVVAGTILPCIFWKKHETLRAVWSEWNRTTDTSR